MGREGNADRVATGDECRPCSKSHLSYSDPSMAVTCITMPRGVTSGLKCSGKWEAGYVACFLSPSRVEPLALSGGFPVLLHGAADLLAVWHAISGLSESGYPPRSTPAVVFRRGSINSKALRVKG